MRLCVDDVKYSQPSLVAASKEFLMEVKCFLPCFLAVCLDRQTGAISGFYYDPQSAPFQFLQLQSMAADGVASTGLAAAGTVQGGCQSMSFGSYALR